MKPGNTVEMNIVKSLERKQLDFFKLRNLLEYSAFFFFFVKAHYPDNLSFLL